MYDVAIAGGGPTGVIAANLCGVYGLSAVVLDRADDVYDLPRAVGMWDDVQRILHDAGILDEAMPAMCDHVGAEFVDPDGKRIIGLDFPPGFVTPNGYPIVRGFHQPGMERAARRCLDKYDNVELRAAKEVTDIRQGASSVTVTVRDTSSRTEEEIETRWLIGCDGASSLVRKTCGIAWNSLGYDHEWLVVDVALERDVGLSPYMQQVCDPARPTTVIPLPLGMHRWEFQLRPGETKDEMEEPERVWSLLEPWMSRSDGELVRAVVYRFHATIADTFRRDRILLAGDAAHQTPPFMGQGLCSGARDAHNLVWKLQHVEHGLTGEALLDTYTDERHPMAVAMVEHSVNTGKLIDAYADMASGGPEPPEDLQAYAYGGSAQLPHLSTGLLSDTGNEWEGRLVPLCTAVTDGAEGPIDDVAGPRWAVVARDDPRGSLSSDIVSKWERLGAAFLRVPEPGSAMMGALLSLETVAVRPDRIIYGAASRPPDI